MCRNASGGMGIDIGRVRDDSSVGSTKRLSAEGDDDGEVMALVRGQRYCP